MRAQFPKDFNEHQRKVNRAWRRSQRTFGVTAVVAVLLWLAWWGLVIFVGVHFIRKWW